MHRNIVRWAKRNTREVFRRFGYDLRRYPRGDKETRLFASRVLADAALLPDRYRVELARSLGVSAEAELSTWEEESIHLSFDCPWESNREVLRQPDVPLILGPWLSEVGFELLYWIPLLRRWLSQHGVSPQRVIALSRGGVASWYDGLASRYVDVFDICSPEEFRAGNAGREAELHGKKQFRICAFEQQLIQAAAAHLGWDRYACVHPSLMYQLFKTVWMGSAPVQSVMSRCDYGRFARAYWRPAGLPFKDYVAVKFYHSDCFPRNSGNASFVRNLLEHLARTQNVILLSTGLRLDDHVDAPSPEDLPTVFDASKLMEPRNNLEVQTSIVAHARRLYCTYGGFSYLGPLVDVPTLSFYSHRTFVQEHLDLAYRAFNQRHNRFGAVATSDIETILRGGTWEKDDEARQAA